MNNDRFKIRFWGVTEKRYLENNIDHYQICNDTGEAWRERDGEWFNIDNEVIKEQCIGLEDKNSKLVYEGDIAKWKHAYYGEMRGVVKHYGYTSIIEAIGGDDEGNQDLALHPDEMEGIEIIGNINEHKHLLED